MSEGWACQICVLNCFVKQRTRFELQERDGWHKVCLGGLKKWTGAATQTFLSWPPHQISLHVAQCYSTCHSVIPDVSLVMFVSKRSE